MKNLGSGASKSGYVALIASAALGVMLGYLIRGSQTTTESIHAAGASSGADVGGEMDSAGGRQSLGVQRSSLGSTLGRKSSEDRIAESVIEFRELLDGGKSISDRARFFQMLMEMTPKSAPELAMVFSESAPSRKQLQEEQKMFWQRWAEIDGATACAAIFKAHERLKDSPLSHTAISAWAEQDPAGARAWLDSQEDIPLRHGMMRGLVEGMARTDIAEVQRFIDDGNLSEKEQAHAHWRIARHHLDRGGADAVGKWYDQFADDDPMIEHVSLTAVDIYTAGSVDESLSWVQQLERGEARTAELDQHVRRRLAKDKPEQVIDYLARQENLSGIENSSSFASMATAEWIRANPNGMGKWLGENMNIPNYDLVTAPFVRSIVRRDPEAASRWAETLKDPELRRSIQAELEGER